MKKPRPASYSRWKQNLTQTNNKVLRSKLFSDLTAADDAPAPFSLSIYCLPGPAQERPQLYRTCPRADGGRGAALPRAAAAPAPDSPNLSKETRGRGEGHDARGSTPLLQPQEGPRSQGSPFPDGGTAET